MNESEFIELLNLYVDHEISARDALRLESAVLADPRRREVYDQYCRMAKACTMLSGDLVAEPIEVDFRPTRVWGFGPMTAGLAAAAACAVVIVGFKYRASELASLALSSPVAVAPATTPAASVAVIPASAPMKPVFLVRPLDLGPSVRAALAAAAARPTPATQLDWIGAIHLTPVFNATNSDLMSPKTGLKATGLADAAANQDSQEPAEMTAFRFQR